MHYIFSYVLISGYTQSFTISTSTTKRERLKYIQSLQSDSTQKTKYSCITHHLKSDDDQEMTRTCESLLNASELRGSFYLTGKPRGIWLCYLWL